MMPIDTEIDLSLANINRNLDALVEELSDARATIARVRALAEDCVGPDAKHYADNADSPDFNRGWHHSEEAFAYMILAALDGPKDGGKHGG